MAITTDEILGNGKRPVVAVPPVAPVDPFLAGAPPTPPGSGDDTPKPPVTGHKPVVSATIPASISPDIAGAPKAGQVIANPVKAPTDKEVVTPVGDQQKAAAKPKLSYVEMFQQMSPYKPPTPEELEKERKKQKREAIFATIGEGISAMSNLYFTTQYAPDSFDATKGMAATTKARFDQLKKDRENNQREYMKGFMQAMRWDDEGAQAERVYQHTLEREKLADHYKEAAEARAQAKADRDAAMAQLRMDLMEGCIDQQEAVAEAKRIQADYAEAYWQSRIGKNNYRRPIGSGGRGGEYPWYDADGNKHYAGSYEAMRQNAIDAGTWNEGSQTSVTQRTKTDRRGKTKDSTKSSTTKPAKGHSSKPAGKRPNPMGSDSGGGGGKKKKNPMS